MFTNEIQILPGEEERAKKALEALREDPHAPREISLRFTLHVHNEYPKLLYKGTKTFNAKDAEEEKAAIAQGYGDYVAPKPVEEAV